MRRFLQAGVWLLGAAALYAADQKAAPKTAPPPRAAAAKPPRNENPNRAPNVPKANGPRLTNPASPAARLFQATPEQRERALEKLPPAQQEQIRKNLAWFDQLPKEQQAVVLRRTERFAALTPEARRDFVQQMQALNKLPPERNRAVRQALIRLQGMPQEQRTALLGNAQFQSRFSPEEQRIIANLSEVMLPRE